MKYLSFVFIYYLTTFFPIFALPITTTTSSLGNTIEEDNTYYYVSVDRLSQIISTHLQFDHFDSVISNTDNVIAKEFQHHIQINIDDDALRSHSSNQYAIQHQLPTLDMMDLEILKSQIFAAIQAHTEGNLPLVRDKLEEDKLSKQQLESFIRQLIYQTCPSSLSNDDTVVKSNCLEENASYLANQLDNYIQLSLDHIFTLLDTDILPDLLQHTAKDLKGILNYFNSAFLQDGNRKFVLKVIPWTDDQHDFKSKLLDLADNGSEVAHSTAFFIEYALMAKL